MVNTCDSLFFVRLLAAVFIRFDYTRFDYTRFDDIRFYYSRFDDIGFDYSRFKDIDAESPAAIFSESNEPCPSLGISP